MEVILYNSENEMPCYLRKEKDESWDIIDQNAWQHWNYIPISESQPSKFHSHVTWNSHRQDYFNRARILRETHKAAAMRESTDDKMTTASEYEAEMAEAEAQQLIWDAEEAAEEAAMKAKALQSKLDINIVSNTNPPTSAKTFKKLTPAEKAAKKALANKKYYDANKNKIKPKKTENDVMEVCPICGGEHKATPIGRSNHNVSYRHTTKLILLHAASGIMKKKANITTMEQAELYIANLIKKAEDKLNRKLTRAEIKNKYKRLAAQYSL
tara:strand:+ start:2625 stop:3431 length:807 start_codon:yes stop_codon:yes gene_type:complete